MRICDDSNSRPAASRFQTQIAPILSNTAFPLFFFKVYCTCRCTILQFTKSHSSQWIIENLQGPPYEKEYPVGWSCPPYPEHGVSPYCSSWRDPLSTEHHWTMIERKGKRHLLLTFANNFITPREPDWNWHKGSHWPQGYESGSNCEQTLIFCSYNCIIERDFGTCHMSFKMNVVANTDTTDAPTLTKWMY